MMAKNNGGLNKAKGLDALLSANRTPSSALSDSVFIKKQPGAADDKSVVNVKISSVVPNREQPRKSFDPEALQELAESIAQHGIIVPLLVRKKGDYYEIIAGERRWRAAKLAKIKEVPVIIREYSERELAEIALIENIQREDLNPIEEAAAYQRLVEEYGLTQEEVAEKVSKSRTAVTNSLRLLKLDERVSRMPTDEIISMGHARALLAIENPEAQYDAAKVVVERKFSVRETEKYVKKLLNPKKAAPAADTLQLDVQYEMLQERLTQGLGTRVVIKRKKSGGGSIEIDYYSPDEFERLIKLIDVKETKG